MSVKRTVEESPAPRKSQRKAPIKQLIVDSSDEEEVPLSSFDSESEEEEATVNDEALEMKLDAKTESKLFSRLKKNKNHSSERGVVYLGRIPHGFYEKQMQAYFSQFGSVTRLRLSRNKKTGHSKHFAFIEFQNAEVASIVSETMHNYLLFGHLLQCRLVPASHPHYARLFAVSKRDVARPKADDSSKQLNRYRAVPWRKIAREQHNKDLTKDQLAKREKRAVAKRNALQQKLKEAGIEYSLN